MVLVLDLKSTEKRIVFLRTADGRFAVILTEQRNRLHGYHAVYLRGCFNTWKCSGKLDEETSDVMRRLLMFSVPIHCYEVTLEILPEYF